MKTALWTKIKEALLSVLPVVAIVVLMSATPLVNLTGKELTVFLLSAFFLIIGIGLFNLGADMAMSPMGEYMGTGLAEKGSLTLLLFVSFLMGVLITVAEPDLAVLAGQVSAVVDETVLIVTVGLGVGLFLLFSILKMVFRKSLSSLLMLFYMLLFALASILIETGKTDFLPMAFDSGGVTTGPITVPFIMAFGIGIAATIGGHDADENSFGIIALCSIGPMLAVICISLCASGNLSYTLADYAMDSVLSEGVFHILLEKALEVLKALGLILLFFGLIQKTILKLPKETLIRIAVGIAYTFVGLVLFLTAAYIGFMPVGFKLGCELMNFNRGAAVIFGFIIGCVVVLAEPAVHVLNKQVENITNGTVTKRSMLIALAVGTGLSVSLSIVRIIRGFSILYYLIPGYFISLMLSLFVPGIYTAIAFDSGGVASGPLTSSFILPLAIGVCTMNHGAEGVLRYAFGIVAMVAMTPLITIQLLGFRAVAAKAIRERIVMKRIMNADDEQIIYFDMEA